MNQNINTARPRWFLYTRIFSALFILVSSPLAVRAQSPTGNPQAGVTIDANTPAKTLDRITLSIDPKCLNPVRDQKATAKLTLTGFYTDGSQRLLRPPDATIQARTKSASGNVTVVAIEGDRVVPTEGGIATVEAIVEKGGARLRAATDVVVAPFYRDYHQTLVLKLFLGMEGRTG